MNQLLRLCGLCGVQQQPLASRSGTDHGESTPVRSPRRAIEPLRSRAARAPRLRQYLAGWAMAGLACRTRCACLANWCPSDGREAFRTSGNRLGKRRAQKLRREKLLYFIDHAKHRGRWFQSQGCKVGYCTGQPAKSLGAANVQIVL